MSLKIITNIFYKPTEEFKRYMSKINQDNNFVLVNGGASLKNSDDAWVKDNVIFDNTGDNISHLNNRLNELTSMYFAWKNQKLCGIDKADYIGFNHYRRLFNLETLKDLKCEGAVSEPVKIIYAKKWLDVTLQYICAHYAEDFKAFCVALKDAGFPINLIKEWSKLGYLIAPFNTFVVRRDYFDKYCNDLFSIIFKLNDIIDVSDRDDYQKRALAFLSERFTSFWFYHKLIKDKIMLREVKLDIHENWKPVNSGD